MTTGEKISKARKELGLTQEEFAGRLGVTRQSVSRWESDLAFPETDKLVTMSKLFNCSVDYLLKYGEEDCSAKPQQSENVLDRFKNRHFEYKSKKTFKGLPLVHVNIGWGRTAKGVIAIGLKAYGVLAVGLLACGVFSFGLLAVGLVALGTLGAGFAGLGAIGFGVFAFGGAAVGIISFGGVAVGLFAFGGCAAGAFSFGGYAYGGYIAIGDIAKGGIALGGSSAQGKTFSATVNGFKELAPQIYKQFDSVPAVFSVLTDWCKHLFEEVLNGNITLGGINL